MSTQRNRESLIQAPGSLESTNNEYIQKQVQKRTERENKKTLSDAYRENTETFLNESEFDDASKKQLRSYLENPLIQNEIISQISKTDGRKDDLVKLVEQVLKNKETISEQLAERDKKIKSLKGKLGHWKSQSKILETTGNENLPKKIKAFTDIHNRIESLTKEIRKSEKKGLDLTLPTETKIASQDEVKMQETTSLELHTQLLEEKKQQDEKTVSHKEVLKTATLPKAKTEKQLEEETEIEFPASEEVRKTPQGELTPQQGGFVDAAAEVAAAVEAVNKAKIEKTKPSFKRVEMVQPSIEQKPFAQQLVQTAELDQQNKFPERVDAFERRADVGGVQLEAKKVGDTYVLEFPQAKMNIELGDDPKKAERILTYAMQEAGKLKNKKDLNPLIDKVSFVLMREQNLKKTHELENRPIPVTRDKFGRNEGVPIPDLSFPEKKSEARDNTNDVREMDIVTEENFSDQEQEALDRIEHTRQKMEKTAYDQLSYEVQVSIPELKHDAERYAKIPYQVKQRNGLPQSFGEIMQLKGTPIPDHVPGKFMGFIKSLFNRQSERAKMFYKAFEVMEQIDTLTKKQESLKPEAKKVMTKAGEEMKGRSNTKSKRPKGLV